MKLSDFKIDPNRMEPKYEQVKNILLTYIENLSPEDEYLPYEQKIAKNLRVGQITVRRALQELRDQGIIETIRNRGSKVIRSQPQSSNGESENSQEASLANTTVGLLLPKFDPNATKGHHQWRISRAFERLAAKQGCKVEFYGLNDPQWRDIEKLADSLSEKNIKWVYLCAVPGVNTREIADRLRRDNIKIATFIDSFSTPDFPLLNIAEGIDWVSCNYQEGLRKTLQEHFSKVEQIIYVADKSNLSWARERIRVTELFCEQNEIDYLDIVSDLGEEHVDAERIRREFSSDKKQLFIGANDKIALAICDVLEELPPNDRQKLSIMGFDNYFDYSQQRQLSTFDHNEESIAESLWFLFRQFFNNKESRHLSNGQFVFPIYISRASTKAASL